jgi:hypothetical protein
MPNVPPQTTAETSNRGPVRLTHPTKGCANCTPARFRNQPDRRCNACNAVWLPERTQTVRL